MSKKKGTRLIAMLLMCVLMAGAFTTTAFAYADDTDQDLPVTEGTLPEDMPPADETPDDGAAEQPDLTPGEPFDDEGNAYTRDLLYDKDCHKQFITVTTKNGNTFYIVIDYDKPVDEDEEQYQTYFLNLVDERDLLDLIDEEDQPDMSCNCTDLCAPGAVSTDCPVCKNNMGECTGKAPEEPEPSGGEDDPAEQPDEPDKGKAGGVNIGIIAVILLLAVAGGGAYYYFKFVRGRKQKDEDLDFYDDDGYEDGPYINEDEDSEPDIADDDEDEETEGEDE